MPSRYRPAIHDSHLAVAVVGMNQPTIIDRQGVAAALVTVSYEDALVARSHVDLDVDSEASARDELERSPPFDRGHAGPERDRLGQVGVPWRLGHHLDVVAFVERKDLVLPRCRFPRSLQLRQFLGVFSGEVRGLGRIEAEIVEFPLFLAERLARLATRDR